MRAEAIAAGTEWKKYGTEDKSNWFGVSGPYLNFFTGFGLRMKELRIGHSNMPHSKSDDVMKSVPVAKYGLYGCHRILLEGCTFPPEKRSSMSQSLGCMTSLLCYLKSSADYEKKWKLRSRYRTVSTSPAGDCISYENTF